MLNKILSVVIVVMVTSCVAVQAKTGEEDVNLKTGLVLDEQDWLLVNIVGC